MGKILSFINLKGGVGKTTCCVNIAGILAHEGKKVLAVDLDAQANLSAALLGTARYHDEVRKRINAKDQCTVFQIFLDAIQETDLFSFSNHTIRSVVHFKDGNPLPKLDLVPSSVDLMRLEREIVNYDRTKYRILFEKLKEIKDEYDYILIDCPPNIYVATHNALYASDYYAIPTIPDFLSITGIPLLTRTLKKTADIKLDEKDQETKLAGIIVNLLDKRLTIHNETITDIKQMLQFLKDENIVTTDAEIFEPHIRSLVDVKKALDTYAPLCISHPRSNSTAEFRECTHSIIDHIAR